LTKPYHFKHFIQAVGLIALLPLLVGHGFGGSNFKPCVKSDPKAPSTIRNYETFKDSRECYVRSIYFLSGSSYYKSDINIGNSLELDIKGASYQSLEKSMGKSISTLVIKESSLSQASYASVSINRVARDSGLSGFGELWMHDFLGNGVKLVHPTKYPSLLALKFDVQSSDYGSDQNSTISNLSGYMLAGDSLGLADIELGDTVEISINEQIIYEMSSASSPVKFSPLVFKAIPGDKLHIVVKNSDQVDQNISSLWLFTPSGDGIKLFHGGVEGDSSIDFHNTFIDVSYELPSYLLMPPIPQLLQD